LLKSVSYRVGHWTFVPSAHELRSRAVRVRLEHRASSTLSLLCERAGEVVSRDQIIERAWGRRHLSPNSVAVVIGDLRRALDIPAGEPGSIETLPKAGYRLVPTVADDPHGSRRRAPRHAPLALIVAFALALFASSARPARPEIAIGSIKNDMATERYRPLMAACNETLLVALNRYPDGLRVIEGPIPPGERTDFVLEQRWVLWSGDPELVLVARDRSGRTVWSGAIYGSESRFPAKISDEVREFAAFARSGK
jgi:DNA-binding winged helix-turn-helix (wHTH) protein